MLAFPAAALGWLGMKAARTPLPTPEDEDVAAGLSWESWFFRTDDGAVLKGKRYLNEGAQPVILAHGFSGNGNEFDLPRREHNLAVYLARRGYDVWVSSFRGNGREPNLSLCNGWSHSMDHLAAYDAPALIEGVTVRTGRRPAWIGHSMGGMVLYMYLQGASFRRREGREVFSADLALAAERNQQLACGVAIGSPPAFAWPKGGFFGLLSNSRAVRALLGRALALLEERKEAHPRFPVGLPISRMAWRHPLATAMLATTPVAITFYNWKNVESDVAVSIARWGTDDVSTAMACQLLRSILEGEVRSFDGSYSYTGNMGRITAPILFVTGSEDFANPEIIAGMAYEAVESEVRDFLNIPGYGHTDLVMGRGVAVNVYRPIADWLDRITQKAPAEALRAGDAAASREDSLGQRG